jgi:hypothetical protein
MVLVQSETEIPVERAMNQWDDEWGNIPEIL